MGASGRFGLSKEGLRQLCNALLLGAKSITSLIAFLSFGFNITACSAQASFEFKDQRADENYYFLKDSTKLIPLDAVKFISLSNSRNSYLSIGGSYRPRFEHFSNNDWISGNDENYYSQRLSFHTDWHFGKHIRLFGEFYHGYKTEGKTILQTDELDWHQGFVEVYLPLLNHELTVSIGRQEMKLGSGRLVDLRIGTNIRRSFDLGKVSFKNEKLSLDAFYGKEVQIGFDAFDNSFDLFNEGSPNPRLWGAMSQFLITENTNSNSNHYGELYYLGFKSDYSEYSDVAGEEQRNSIGLRSYGSIKGRFQFNTEFIYQFGDLAGNSIGAFNFETDWKYVFMNKKWRPTIGLKLDWSSGDEELNDGKLNSFNPMFVNPSIYSLAAVNTPVNLLSFHPSFIFFPTEKWMVNIEFAAFFRASKNDGLYTPPRFQTRTASGISDNHIGNTIGLFITYTHNRYIDFDIRTSYFMAGDFVEASGSSEAIFQFAPTLNLRF